MNGILRLALTTILGVGSSSALVVRPCSIFRMKSWTRALKGLGNALWHISGAELTERFQQRTKPGSANGKTTKAPSAPPATASISEPVPSTSATSVMDTARAATRSVNLESSISAKLTPPVSNGFTVWSENPIGYADRGCPKITDADLLSLGPKALKLQEIAVGRNEPIEETVRSIIAFYVNVESPWLSGNLGDLLLNYLENQVI